MSLSPYMVFKHKNEDLGINMDAHIFTKLSQISGHIFFSHIFFSHYESKLFMTANIRLQKVQKVF